MKNYFLKNIRKIVQPFSSDQSGAVLVMVAIILASSIVLSLALWSRISSFVHFESHAHLEEKVLSITEGGLDKAIWELNQNESYTGETGTSLGDGEFSISVVDVDSVTKTITAIGYIPNASDPIVQKTIEIEALKSGNEINFQYGMQADEGGVLLGSSNDIQGSVFSNGSVVAAANSGVTGSVWVAGNSLPSSDVSYEENGGVDLGSGLDFDGTDDYVTVPNSASLDMSSSFTMAAWFKSETGASSFDNLIGKFSSGVNEWNYFLDFNSSEQFTMGWDGVTQCYSGSTFNLGEWTHVAVVFNDAANTISYYINGALDNTCTGISSTPTPVAGDAYFGAFYESGSFTEQLDGSIDEIQIWNTTRTLGEIQTSMTDGLVGNESGLAGYWKFNEGTGQTLYDETSNGNDGYRGSTTGSDTNDPAWLSSSSVGGNSYKFGHASNYRDVAMSFVAGSTGTVNEIDVRLKKYGNPSNLTLRLVDDVSGQPGLAANEIASDTLQASWVTTDLNWITVDFTSDPSVVTGTTYWIVLDGTSDSSNYYYWGSDPSQGYADGEALRSRNWNGSSWSSVAEDMNFRVKMNGVNTSFTGAGGVTVGGDLHAHSIDSVTVTGDAYYQSINNATAANYYPGSADPSQANMPISQAEIDAWKDEAFAGGVYSGDYTTCGSTIGPVQITGNLTLTTGCTLTITGTVWVQGDIILQNNNTVQLDSSYGGNGGVIVATGTIELTNGNQILGSGAGDSYLLLISESSGGDVGNALNFDGTNDYVQIADSNALDLTGGQFTIEAWINPDSFGENGQGRIVDHGGGSGGNGWAFHVDDYGAPYGTNEGLQLQINSAEEINSDPYVISTGVWQHVAVVFDNGDVTFYVDGVESGINTGASTPAARSAPVRVGRRADDSYRSYDGAIDDVRIWSTARTQGEIQTDMSHELSGYESNLVGYWKFNEGTGQTASDSTSNGFDGQLGSSSGSDSADPTWISGYDFGSPAITVNSNDLSDAILFAPNGKILINSTAQLLELAGYAIELSNNVTLVYESGLANATFGSGGGAWAMRDGTWVPK